MRRWWNRLLFWRQPLFRRRCREAPRSASALTLITALSVLCGGAILGRAAHYGTMPPGPAPPAPRPAPKLPPHLTMPGSRLSAYVIGGVYHAGASSGPSMPHVGLLEPLPAELMGRQFVRDLGMIVVLLLFFIAPGPTSQVYTEQRKHKTFDLLLLTPLRPASIVLGDWLGYAFPLALVCLITLPFFVVSIAYGGVSLFEVGCIFGVAFALAFALASVGLSCSTLCNSSSGSSILAFFLGLPLAALAVLGIELLATGSGNFLDLRSPLLPFEAAVMLLAAVVSTLVALNSLWWAIADFEYLYYSRRGEPVPGQRESFLEEGL